MESLKELLHTYEQSIERKDQVISNLTHAMQKQREKIEMLKKFNEWKLKHIDRKREVSNYN
jgi:centrosomal protein POC5